MFRNGAFFPGGVSVGGNTPWVCDEGSGSSTGEPVEGNVILILRLGASRLAQDCACAQAKEMSS
jgi:hypothetical protein